MSAARLIDGALEKVRATAGVKTVYGEPIKVDGKTIIPIAKVAYGAKAGTGHGVKDVGAFAAPIGVVEVSEQATKFVPIGLKRKLALAGAVGAAAGIAAGVVLARRTPE